MVYIFPHWKRIIYYLITPSNTAAHVDKCVQMFVMKVYGDGEAGGGGGGGLEGVMSTVACTACVSVSQLQGILVTSVARLEAAVYSLHCTRHTASW